MSIVESHRLFRNLKSPLVWWTLPHEDGPTIGRCYVAGPMTGHPQFNYRAFDAARDVLAEEGWMVINPADLDRQNLNVDFSKMDGTEDLSAFTTRFARQDIESLLLVDRVFLLPGWERSTGANNEARIATMLGVPCFSFATREQVTIDARFSNTAAPK